MQLEEEVYLTIEEAKQQFGFPRTTLYRFAKDGKITFHHIPRKRHILIPKSQLEALAKPRVKPTPKTNTQPGG